METRSAGGVLCAAGLVSLASPLSGASLAIGVLWAVRTPIPGKARIIILAVGSLAGASMFLGGALAHLPDPLTALVLIGLVTLAAVLSVRVPGGERLLTLCAPMVGAGLSNDDWAASANTFALVVCGSAYAWLISLMWPVRKVPDQPRAAPATTSREVMIAYGLRMGVAAAIGYLMASGLGLDHPGWAPTACLLVARPDLDLMELRGGGERSRLSSGRAWRP